MARTNSLANFLTDVANAIRTKKGTETTIAASTFDTEILNLPSGTYQTKNITISANGSQTITPDTGYDAIDEITITTQVPQKQLQTKSYEFTTNQTIELTPDTGYDGFDIVTLTINVPQSSGGDIKLFETVQTMQADPNPQEGDLAVVYREEIQPVTEESEFSSCTFPQTVVLKEAFTGNVYGRFRAVDSSSGYFDGNVDMSSSNFRFNGWGESSRVRVQYTSSDGITYTRTDGGEELQEFGTVIKYEPMGPWNNVIGNFMQIGTSIFEGIYIYKNNSWKLAPTQLTATSDYVYKQLFYGKNGLESGALAQNISNSFNDANADIYSKIQLSYNNISPRVLTDSDKSIDNKIFIIPVKLDGTPLLDTSKVTNMDSMFRYCSNLTAIPLLDTSSATDMNLMFTDCSSLTAMPELKTSKVTNMAHTFQGCSKLTAIPLLDTSNVTNMRYMFNGCTNLTAIPELDTSSVTDMNAMFTSCSKLTTIPELDTSKVKDMSNMFQDCSNLTTIPQLNTSNVFNMAYMFQDCSKLTTIPLLNTSKVTDMRYMFNGCTNLSDDSLNIIMQMCINATSYTGTKTLKIIGLTSEQATKCTTLSNYSAFTSAGWTTGY